MWPLLCNDSHDIFQQLFPVGNDYGAIASISLLRCLYLHVAVLVLMVRWGLISQLGGAQPSKKWYTNLSHLYKLGATLHCFVHIVLKVLSVSILPRLKRLGYPSETLCKQRPADTPTPGLHEFDANFVYCFESMAITQGRKRRNMFSVKRPF